MMRIPLHFTLVGKAGRPHTEEWRPQGRPFTTIGAVLPKTAPPMVSLRRTHTFSYSRWSDFKPPNSGFQPELL